MGKNKKRDNYIFYSTNPDAHNPFEDLNILANDKSKVKQCIRVQMERKGRGGKTVTIVRGFEGSAADFKELARKIKSHCGTGGSVKDGEIIVQGDVKQKVVAFLKKLGYVDTK
jgi:translation initiation factor 1